MKHSVVLCLLLALLQSPLPLPAIDSSLPARIAFLSDTHVRWDSTEQQALNLGRLQRVIAAVNRAKVDLVLVTGDLTENGNEAELRLFDRQTRKFDAPIWAIPGNHDVGSKPVPGTAQKPTITPRRLRRYELTLGRSWFARRRSGVRVIGLNGSLLGTGWRQEEQMWAMLEKELAGPSHQPTLLLLHYPLFAQTADEPGGEYWNVEPAPRQRLLRLLDSQRVSAVLSGHLHRGLTNHYNGVLLLTTAAVAFGLPEKQQPEGWTLFTVTADRQVQAQFQSIRLPEEDSSIDAAKSSK